MAGKIFINYRRGDDPGSAQALFARSPGYTLRIYQVEPLS
jgi:hypothetical protein